MKREYKVIVGQTLAELVMLENLDRAAAMRREAARNQELAWFLCRVCRAPDGQHVSECVEAK